jgi:hypothetical protein
MEGGGGGEEKQTVDDWPWQGLLDSKADQKVAREDPAWVHGIASQEGNDDRSAAKDQCTREEDVCEEVERLRRGLDDRSSDDNAEEEGDVRGAAESERVQGGKSAHVTFQRRVSSAGRTAPARP